MKKIIARRKIQEGEGWWDSVSAFGRQAADTATLGGYKYARAGVDYAAKNAASALGYGQGTTYSKELDQEKEKLAHDDKEHSQASSAGKLAGYGAMTVAPNVPVAGTALSIGDKATKIPYYLGLAKRAVGLEENLAGAGTSGDGGMSAPFSAMGQEIDSRRKQKPIPLGKTMGSYVDEENVVGGGAVAGLGIGPQGEPGRPPELMPMQRRKTPRGKFMNMETFIVPHSTFVSLKEAKRKGKHWRTYLNEDDAYHDIREYAKSCKGPIIVEDERTGAMMYIRYGKGGSLQEAWTNRVGRGGSLYLSSAGRELRSVSMYNKTRKIGNYNKEHSIYVHDDVDDDYQPTRHYHLVHNATGHITHSVNGPIKKGVLKIAGAGASEDNKKIGTKVKMEDFYHHLLKRGARHEASGSKERNPYPVALKGTSHSGPGENEEGDYGAQRVWRNLAKKRGAVVHGWIGGKKGKAVNLGKADDPSETHADPHDYNDYTGEPNRGADPESTQVGRTALVASVNLPKKKKIKARVIVRRRRGR